MSFIIEAPCNSPMLNETLNGTGGNYCSTLAHKKCFIIKTIKQQMQRNALSSTDFSKQINKYKGRNATWKYLIIFFVLLAFLVLCLAILLGAFVGVDFCNSRNTCIFGFQRVPPAIAY